MEPAWLKKKKEIPSVVSSLFNDAKQNGSWIYHKPTRRFFTPEEFIEDWGIIYREGIKGSNNREEFQIMNPMAAIRQRSQWVTKASSELQEIMKKLELYQANFKTK